MPASDDRSLISATTTLQPAAYDYRAHQHEHEPADAQHNAAPATTSHQHTAYAALPADDIRHAVSPTDMSYIAHGPARSSLGGTVGGAPDQARATHVSQEYHHDPMPFRDLFPQLHPVTMYSSSEDSALSAYPSRPYDAALSDVRSAASHSSMSRSPPPHQHALPAGSGSQTPTPKLPPKRREKPHIELSPDQPLTTQGKQRARVYVACVQWSAIPHFLSIF